MTEPKRYHDVCGKEVTLDDPEEPMWWCPTCQDTVDTEDTHTGEEWPPVAPSEPADDDN